MTEPERIAIVDLADDLRVRKQRIFKILRRLGIRPTQRRETSRRNQRKQTKLVLAWAELPQEELIADWQLVMNGEEPFKIQPLQ